ncbi:MAG: hypothetical protein ACRYF2_08925 [Janthinobacterium lividum]
MLRRRQYLLVRGALTGLAFSSLVLAGCNKSDEDSGNNAALPALPATLPMMNSPVQPASLAPPPSALSTRAIRTARVADPRAAYAYADQAGYFSQFLGNGPPDYGFDYDGVRPWVWQAYDGSRVFLEPVDGGYRYYYYRAGAERPYFVRDPQFAYGYNGDQLAAIYGPDGGLVPYNEYGARQGYAAAYLWRAQRLFEASRDRQAISASAWAARQDSIAAYRDRWAANSDRQADWAAYHAEESGQESRYWADEAARREADAQRFAAWHQQDFRTPPPPRAIPPSWQQASWARDSTRYAPIAATAIGGAALIAVAHERQAAAARNDAFQRQALPSAPQQQQPLVPSLSRPVDRGGREGQPDLSVRSFEPAPHVLGSSQPLASHTALAPSKDAAPRRPFDDPRQQPIKRVLEEQNHAAPLRQPDERTRGSMRPPVQTVTVHYAKAEGSRSPAPPMDAEQRHGEPAHMAIKHPAPSHQPPEPIHAPVAPPHVAQAAPHRSGGEHPANSRPEGGHPGDAHRNDHHP